VSAIDQAWISRALELAEKGRGHAEPSALNAAVLATATQVIAETWQSSPGQFPLERILGGAAGGTLYFAIEPSGLDARRLKQARVERVVIAIRHPQGDLVEQLRASGIATEVGIGEAAALALNEPFLKLTRRKQPYLHAQWGMSLDGKIATRVGHSKWISNDLSLQKTHQLRGRMDAILVGIGTVLADDPLLTARPTGPRVPARIILDAKGRFPMESRLAATAAEAPVIVVVGESHAGAFRQKLSGRPIECLALPEADGYVSLPALLAELGRRAMTNVLVEGGSIVHGAFFDADRIDETHVFISPLVIGGACSPSPVAGQGHERIDGAFRFADVRISQLGGDLYLNGRAGRNRVLASPTQSTASLPSTKSRKLG